MNFTGTFVSTAFNPHSMKNFSPLAQCDQSLFPVKWCDLVPYFEYAGTQLYDTGIRAHKKYVDKPDTSLMTPPILMDPEPVDNPRPLKNFMPWY